MKFRIGNNYRVKQLYHIITDTLPFPKSLEVPIPSLTKTIATPNDVFTLIEANDVVGYGIDYIFQFNKQKAYVRLIDFEADRILLPEKVITKFRELIEKNRDEA